MIIIMQMNILVSQFNTPAFNLSAEEYLFSKTGENYLFLYINEPSVIIGSNQAVLNEVDIDFCIDNSILIIRRLSGGGAVYHDFGNINYSFIHELTEKPLSAQFLDPVIEVLKRLGINAEIGKRKDLWLEGLKISGTASHISKGRELHHGTLLYDTNIDMLRGSLTPAKRDLVKKATQSVVSPVTNINCSLSGENGSPPDTDSFFKSLKDLFVDYYEANGITDFSDADIVEIEKLQREKYTNREWNYRK